jgi:phosphoribosylformimino-5-aminoimidazole carboxamide ribotide isomerase
MIIYPAIDLRRGCCVRLRQGDPTAETVYGDDPAATAAHWVSQGAAWLHVVNLDGALGDRAASAANLAALSAMHQRVAVPIQFGGGLRSLDDVAEALALGAARVVLGTIAVQRPDLVAAALQRFGPERIVAGLDARDGYLATHGWQAGTTVPLLEAATLLRDLGVVRAVYTDIARDGMLSGVDAAGASELARRTGLAVIASGGVRDLEDIRLLALETPAGVEGVIAGQALYAGALSLAEALAVAR